MTFEKVSLHFQCENFVVQQIISTFPPETLDDRSMMQGGRLKTLYHYLKRASHI